MKYLWTFCALLLVCAASLPAVSAASAPPAAPAVRSHMVVSTDWLSKHLRDPGVVVLHVARERTHYDAGHVSGARFVSWGDITATRAGVPNELAPVQDLQKLFERVGVGDRRRIVLYGDQSGLSAARAYFTLDYLGHGDRTSILDGGLEKWRTEQRPVSTEAPPVAPAPFRPQVRPSAVAALDVMRDISWAAGNLTPPGVALIDARPFEEYTGAKPGEGVARAGHIPGAANVFWMQNLVSKENPVLQPVADLRRLYEAAGARADAKVVTYCRTGGQAAHTYFLARYLGYDVVMYDGSFFEWNRAEGTPVTAGAEKR